jgi:hypothetical protein
LTVLRVARGGPAPTEVDARAAIARDRSLLRLPEKYAGAEVTIVGPYLITDGDKEFDEYVIWER